MTWPRTARSSGPRSPGTPSPAATGSRPAATTATRWRSRSASRPWARRSTRTTATRRTSGPGFGVTVHPGALTQPYRWRTPKVVFVNSMSDLFHAKVPLDFIRDVFDVIRETPQHTYQVLTKRAHRMARIADKLDWPDNLWMGVSVESFDVVDRIDHLRATSLLRRGSCRASRYSTALPGAEPRRHRLGHRRRRVRARARDRWTPRGWRTSATSASRPAWRSSSSSGAAGRRRRTAASSTGGPGTTCRSWLQRWASPRPCG